MAKTITVIIERPKEMAIIERPKEMAQIVTTEQASDLWCPFTQIDNIGNRHPHDDSLGVPAGTKCISDKCMAWQTVTQDGRGTCSLMTKLNNTR